jgi:hypothetical protein
VAAYKGLNPEDDDGGILCGERVWLRRDVDLAGLSQLLVLSDWLLLSSNEEESDRNEDNSSARATPPS